MKKIIILLVIFLTACSKEDEIMDIQNVCAKCETQSLTIYNAKGMHCRFIVEMPGRRSSDSFFIPKSNEEHYAFRKLGIDVNYVNICTLAVEGYEIFSFRVLDGTIFENYGKTNL